MGTWGALLLALQWVPLEQALGALGEAPVSPWWLQKGPDGDAPAPPTRLLLSSPSSWCLPVSELFFIIMPR